MAWMGNYIPYINMDVFTDTYPSPIQSMLVKETQVKMMHFRSRS